MGIWKNKKFLSSRYVLGRCMDVCKSRMEGEQGKSGMRDGLKKCLFSAVCSKWVSESQRRAGAEGVDWKWFGLEWVISGGSWISWSRNRHFPNPSELGLLFPSRFECAASFGCQCAWKAVLTGTKPTWNVFISIPANTLQCFSCLTLASFTKTTVRCFHAPTLVLTCDKQKDPCNKGIKSAKLLLILLQDSSGVGYHLFHPLVIHTEPSLDAYLIPLWWCWNALGYFRSINVTCQNGDYLSISLIVKGKWNAGLWMVEVVPAFVALVLFTKRK